MCTAIKINYDQGAVLGRTMDIEPPLDYNILYYPRGYNFGQDLFGQDLIGKYRVLGMCFRNKNPLKDGVNEHGLIGVTNDYSGFRLYSDRVLEGKINISSLDFLSYALSNYKSLEELSQNLADINISTRDYKNNRVLAPAFHFIFTDPSGKCLVVEPKNQVLHILDNPYDVMTNSPSLDSHVRNLKRTMDLDKLKAFNSAKNLPGGYDPLSRFIKAFYLTRTNEASKTYSHALSTAYSILGSLSLPKGFIQTDNYKELTHTIYTSVYDTSSRSLCLRTNISPQVFRIELDQLKDKKERQAIFLEDLNLFF